MILIFLLFILSSIIFIGYYIYKILVLEKRVDKIVRNIHNSFRNNNTSNINTSNR
jgi:hypothetical protein